MAMELDYDYLAKLVECTQMGDSDAFAELYTATYQKQYRFAYQYTKDSYLAQDILQDVYILVLKNIHTLKNPRLFVSWLHQITFRICFDTTQKMKRQEQDIQFDTSDEKNSLSSLCRLQHRVQSGKIRTYQRHTTAINQLYLLAATAVCTTNHHALLQQHGD